MVTEHRDRFLQLARYSPAEVANDGDKQQRFREELDDHLEYALMNHRFDNFNHMVDSALNTERKRREIEDKKRKMVPAATGHGTSTTSSSRGHLHRTSSDSSSTRFVLSSSRRDRARGFQHLQHALLHWLHQLCDRECLLLLPDSKLQHSHGRAITAASRDTTPTFVPGRRSLDSRGAQLSPRRHPRAG
jgi:hypothetical protein